MKNANALKESFRKELREQGDADADQKYFINEGYLLLFQNQTEPTASLHPTDQDFNVNEYIRKKSEKKDGGDAATRKQQSLTEQGAGEEEEFMRYMRILDGDLLLPGESKDPLAQYGTYLVIYTCFEIVDYREEGSGRSISLQELQIKSQYEQSQYEQFRDMRRKEWMEE